MAIQADPQCPDHQAEERCQEQGARHRAAAGSRPRSRKTASRALPRPGRGRCKRAGTRGAGLTVVGGGGVSFDPQDDVGEHGGDVGDDVGLARGRTRGAWLAPWAHDVRDWWRPSRDQGSSRSTS